MSKTEYLLGVYSHGLTRAAMNAKQARITHLKILAFDCFLLFDGTLTFVRLTESDFFLFSPWTFYALEIVQINRRRP